MITFEGDTTGAITNDNARRLDLNFWLMAGSTYSSGTLQTSWGSDTDANRAVGQVNVVDGTSNDFYLTGVQLEVGSQATAFEHRSFGEELSLCERYFQIHIPLGQSGTYFCSAYNYTSSSAFGVVYHRTHLRTAPTLKQTTGTDYYVFYRNGSGDYFDGFESFQWSNGRTGNFRITSGISGTAGHAGAFYTSNSSAYVAFDSEL